MITFTQEEQNEIDERCYFARWGYDGYGTPGPKEPFKRQSASYRSAYRGRSIDQARHHRKGNGWKANHQS